MFMEISFLNFQGCCVYHNLKWIFERVICAVTQWFRLYHDLVCKIMIYSVVWPQPLCLVYSYLFWCIVSLLLCALLHHLWLGARRSHMKPFKFAYRRLGPASHCRWHCEFLPAVIVFIHFSLYSWIPKAWLKPSITQTPQSKFVFPSGHFVTNYCTLDNLNFQYLELFFPEGSSYWESAFYRCRIS